MGYCIGGPFALKLMERAPERIVAGVLCQPVGHRRENPDVMYDMGRDSWGPELCARRTEVTMQLSKRTCTTFTASSPTSCTACRGTSRVRARHQCWSCLTTHQRTRTRPPWM